MSATASFHNNLTEADKARALLHNMELRQGQLSEAEQEWLERVLVGWAAQADWASNEARVLEAQMEEQLAEMTQAGVPGHMLRVPGAVADALRGRPVRFRVGPESVG